jgi:hypothetical protein
MPEHDLEKLLGGFAADTLTPEEKQTLYSAALQDQQLFNALADEQALKELLSDPDVRRRLLQGLQKTGTSGVGGSLSWLDWFRRPAGLALAGGLSAAALAVVLGVRIYQDSLRQAARSVATEEVRPATPQAIEPQVKAKEHVAPAIDLPKKDALIDKLAERERSAPSPSKKEQASDLARDGLKRRSAQNEVRREAEAPVAALSKSAEEIASPVDQKLTASSAPPATAPEPKHIQTPATGRIAATATPALSARALFYGEETGRADTRSMAKEQKQGMKPLAESAPQANRPERSLDGLAQLGKAADATAQLKPLGLRYSFVVLETDGQEREVDAATAAKSTESVRLNLEANQDAYLQVWKTVGSSTSQLLWPEKDTGQIPLKMIAGQREQIPLPSENKPVTLTVRLSRVPPEPTMKQEAGMFDRLTPNQLQESITANNRTGSQERATYVVNRDPSETAQLAVKIILGR